LDTFVIVTVMVAFFLGGGVKGAIGLGLPLTAVALMGTVLDLRTAVPLLIVPVVLTNLWQGLRGGETLFLLRRYWSLYLSSCIGVWIGTIVLLRADASLLLVTLGVMVVIYTAVNLFAVRIRVAERHMPVLSPAVGLFAGVMSGSTGSLGVPVVIYLQALGVARDRFVQAVGLQFLITGVVWIGALAENHMLDRNILIISSLAIIPSVIGMAAGQWLRGRLSQQRFRTWLFVFLLAIGLNLIRKGLF
jgi:uncharacterized membrane protein YfcA